MHALGSAEGPPKRLHAGGAARSRLPAHSELPFRIQNSTWIFAARGRLRRGAAAVSSALMAENAAASISLPQARTSSKCHWSRCSTRACVFVVWADCLPRWARAGAGASAFARYRRCETFGRLLHDVSRPAATGRSHAQMRMSAGLPAESHPAATG